MKITAFLAKVPWRSVARILPGVVGAVAGDVMSRRAEQEGADALKRIDERHRELNDALVLIAARLKLVVWIASAALVVAVAALVVAAMR